MAAQGKRKSQQRGSRFRSRQRLKAMALALGVAMAITMGLLSLVSSTTAPKAEAGAGHVTRHLRGLLLNQVARGYGMAMEAQGTKSRAVAMEALVTRKAGKGDATMAPSTSTSNRQQGRTDISMEAQGRRTKGAKPRVVVMEAKVAQGDATSTTTKDERKDTTTKNAPTKGEKSEAAATTVTNKASNGDATKAPSTSTSNKTGKAGDTMAPSSSPSTTKDERKESTTKNAPTKGEKSGTVAMEALVTRKAGKGDATMAPSTSTSTTNHERTGIITMEALPLKTSNWMSSPDTVAEEEATAEEAKEIAEEAMRVGLRAEEHAQAAEAAAELSIITQVGMATGEQISIFDEIEDSKDSQDSEEKAAKFKKDQGW